MLVGKGVIVVMVCCNCEQVEWVWWVIFDEYFQVCLELVDFDLVDFVLICVCVVGFCQCYECFDFLFNNVGVMFLFLWCICDGFEMQMGINYFGYFVFMGLLLELLLVVLWFRVVGMISGFNQFGWLLFDDFNVECGYNCYFVYCYSKQVNLLFSLELQCCVGQWGVFLQSLVVYLGYVVINLQYVVLVMFGLCLGCWVMKVVNGVFV